MTVQKMYVNGMDIAVSGVGCKPKGSFQFNDKAVKKALNGQIYSE